MNRKQSSYRDIDLASERMQQAEVQEQFIFVYGKGAF
jgi:hypothetical protein